MWYLLGCEWCLLKVELRCRGVGGVGRSKVGNTRKRDREEMHAGGLISDPAVGGFCMELIVGQ